MVNLRMNPNGMASRQIFLLFPALLVMAASSKECPDIYKRFSVNHTACLPPKEGCEIVKSGVSEEEKEMILDIHNKLRSKIAEGKESINDFPSATNMMEMEWDDELAMVAQAHAAQCDFNHDCNECRQTKSFPVGQNLYSYLTNAEPGKARWEEAILSWYNEVSFTSSNDVIKSYEFDPDTGHFTQIIWAKTWKIGCGFTIFKAPKDTDWTIEHLYTCNYGPRGNNLFQKIYEDGPKCSRCPDNTCCGEGCGSYNITSKYDGLCKSVNSDGPIPKMPAGRTTLLKCSFDKEDDDDEGCKTETKGENSWKTVETARGKYKSIVLKGGQKTELTFVKRFKPSKSFCLLLGYRKGPNVAGTASGNSFQVVLSLPKIRRGQIVKVNYESDSPEMFQVKWHAQHWKHETQLSVHFSVPKDAPDQYLDIDDMVVIEGSCEFGN